MQDAKNSIEYQVSSEERKRKEMQEKQFSVFSYKDSIISKVL